MGGDIRAPILGRFNRGAQFGFLQRPEQRRFAKSGKPNVTPTGSKKRSSASPQTSALARSAPSLIENAASFAGLYKPLSDHFIDHQYGKTNPISTFRSKTYCLRVSVRLRDPVALAFVLRTLDAHSDPACLAPPRCGSARQIFRPVLHVSPGPAFDIWLMLMRATTASKYNAARTRASSKLASAAICAFRIECPKAAGAICRAARRIFRAVARSRVIGIASPCLSALRLERALPAAVLGPRLRAPLRRLAAICLSVAILMITIGGYR